MTVFVLVAPSARSSPYVVPPFWQALGTCETGHIGEPGDGKPRWDWGSKRRHLEGATYEGGVGFYWGTWQEWAAAVGVYGRYRHAFLAPPAVQVRVARFGLAHRGYWGCLSEHPSLLELPGR